MNPFKPIAIAFTTYSVIPMPRFKWQEEDMRRAISALPLVGVVLGVIFCAWAYVAKALDLSTPLFAAVAVFLPVAITGGIHFDGFCDVSDALASHQSRESMLEILKDSHIGAFAAIKCSVFFLLQFGLFCQLGPEFAPALSVGFVLSRALSALLSSLLPKARRDGMLAAYAGEDRNLPAAKISAGVSVFSAAALIVLYPIGGVVTVLLCALWCIRYKRMTTKRFGGITGDTAGYFLQIAELLIGTSLVLGSIIERYV